MKRFVFKYPRITILLLVIIFAYIIFGNPAVQEFLSKLGSLSYLGIFIAGIFYSFGFSAPFSTGFFLVLNPSNIWLAGIVGGIGAMLSNLFIFKFVKISFTSEFQELKKVKWIKSLGKLSRKLFSQKLRKFFAYSIAIFLIASPLPNEWGVVVLEEFAKMEEKLFAIFSFVLSTIGILLLFGIGKLF